MTGIFGPCARCGHAWDAHYSNGAPPADGKRCMAGLTNGEPACACPKFVLAIQEGTHR